jgi:hypothetical protein
MFTFGTPFPKENLIIHRLHGSKIGGQIILVDYVVVRMVKMFILDVMVPHSEITRVKELKDLEGTIGIWLAKFLKACL